MIQRLHGNTLEATLKIKLGIETRPFPEGHPKTEYEISEGFEFDAFPKAQGYYPYNLLKTTVQDYFESGSETTGILFDDQPVTVIRKRRKVARNFVQVNCLSDKTKITVLRSRVDVKPLISVRF